MTTRFFPMLALLGVFLFSGCVVRTHSQPRRTTTVRTSQPTTVRVRNSPPPRRTTTVRSNGRSNGRSNNGRGTTTVRVR